jgi:hypothetical protein
MEIGFRRGREVEREMGEKTQESEGENTGDVRIEHRRGREITQEREGHNREKGWREDGRGKARK